VLRVDGGSPTHNTSVSRSRNPPNSLVAEANLNANRAESLTHRKPAAKS
jgi:hypothetical protein